MRVVVLTRGEGDGAAREAEARAACAVLGVEDLEFREPGLPGLARDPELAAVLRALLDGDDSGLVYLPSPFELHPDRRAACAAAVAALAALAGGGPSRRVHFYGVHRHVPANLLIDTTATRESKRQAIERLGPTASTAAAPGRNGTPEEQATGRAAFDRAYAVGLEGPDVPESAEGFVALSSEGAAAHARAAARTLATAPVPDGEGSLAARLPTVTAVISTWNKRDDVRANLEALYAQTRPFDDVVVVDNASTDGTADRIRTEFPDARLIVMPHSAYGACETFNIGFASARTDLIAILDDDVVLPPEWLERAMDRMLAEPETTAIVSTKVVEPGMPESYRTSPAVNTERYMSTFRGCASLARTAALRAAGGYDERLFIYGNERDLTCRLLNLGYRVLQFPGVEAFHKTPFGIKMGKRSLYYHARNAWLAMLKYAPLKDLLRMPFLVVSKVLLRSGSREAAGEVVDATGTIGIGRAVRETPGAWWVLTKAACSVLWNVPYCLKRRAPVSAPDFELPIE